MIAYIHLSRGYPLAVMLRQLQIVPAIQFSKEVFCNYSSGDILAKLFNGIRLGLISNPDQLKDVCPTYILFFGNDNHHKLSKFAAKIGATFRHFTVETVDFRHSK